MPLSGIAVILVYAPRRVHCARCGIKVESIPWTQGKSPVYIALSVVLATWAKEMAWQVVGRFFGFHWNTVRKAVKDVVDYGLRHRDMGNLLYIGLDEISRRKGHVYHTKVYDLTEKQKLRLSDLEKLNLKINRAYLLKEAFRRFWDYTHPAWARKYLDQWFCWATHPRLKPMRDFAWMLRRHQDDILSYFKGRIDNGAVEALNNKAKAISHRAFGYRTAETSKLALFHGLGKLPMPRLTHKFL